MLRDGMRHSAWLLLLGASALISACATVRPSDDYLKNLQLSAIRGEFAQNTRVDVANECPTCDPEATIFAQNVVSAERGFGDGCKGMPSAEASYRKIKTMMEPDNSIPQYEAFVTNRMCQVAEQYQSCAAPEHREIPIGDSAAPAGALTAAIDRCRESNPDHADEILNRAIAQEAESISRSILTSEFDQARRELRVYAALPRSNRQRAQQWRVAIADGQSVQREVAAQTTAEVHSMVCDDRYYVRNPEDGYANIVPGMNMRRGGRLEDGPFERIATDSKESRMAVLSGALSDEAELPQAEAQEILSKAYARASKDKSYCGKERVTRRGE